MPSTQLLQNFLLLKHYNIAAVNFFVGFFSTFYRFVVPMKNGDLDSRGFLSSIIQVEGTIESFKVCILLLNVEEQMTPGIVLNDRAPYFLVWWGRLILDCF